MYTRRSGPGAAGGVEQVQQGMWAKIEVAELRKYSGRISSFTQRQEDLHRTTHSRSLNKFIPKTTCIQGLMYSYTITVKCFKQ